MNINTPGLYSKIKEEGKPVTKPAEPITLADNIKNKLIPDRAKGAAREAFTSPVTNPERGADKPVPKPIEQSRFSRIPRVLKTALYARNTGLKDADGYQYINKDDIELLNKLGFCENPNKYLFLAIGDKVEDPYSYIEKIAGLSKDVVKAIDNSEPFSAEYLKDLDYTVPDGYEVKGDLVLPLEKEAAADPSQTILITGHSGAGKSTLGKLLAEKLNLPLHRVDAHPEFKEYVTKDNEHWKDSLTPGTQEYKHYTDLVNRANRDTLKASDSASIIEGAQLGHLSPEELAKYKAHILVGGDVEQSIAQRIQRAIDKAAKKGITFSPEEIELKKTKSKLVADYWEPGMEKFKQLPGVLRYNHTEDKPELLIDRLKEILEKKAEDDRPHHHLILRIEADDLPNSEKACNELVEELAKEIDMQIVYGPKTKHLTNPETEGYSTFAIITTSHISLHTWNKTKPPLMQIDIFSCNAFSREKVEKYLRKKFKINKISDVFIDRTSAVKIKTAEDNYTLYRGTKEPLAPPDSNYYELLRKALQGELKNRKEQKLLQELARRQRGFFTPDKTLAENYAGTDGHLYSLDLKDSDLSKIYGDYNNLGKANQALVLNVPHELADRARLVEKKAAADHPLKSTNIKAVGYDKKEKTMEVEFHSGGTYKYNDVPKSLFDRIKRVKSPGKFFHKHIRKEDKYPFSKLEKESEYKWYMSKPLSERLTAGRPYPFSYLTGEAGELVDAVKNRDWENFKEEIGDTSFGAQMLLAQATGLNHPVYADLSKAWAREKIWKDLFKEKGSVYHPNHMQGGSNYAKPSKIIKALASAGIKVNQREAERLANKYSGGKMEKESAEKQPKPLPHQRKAVEKLLKKDQEGLVLMHGLGSGKTRTSIEAYKALGLPAEVIVPAALKGNYEKEIKKWVGKLPENIAIKSQQEIARKGLSSDLKNKLMIIDEAHRIRNPGSKLYESIAKASPAKRLLLTGTPIYNHPGDLAAVINAASGKELLPKNQADFEERYIAQKTIPAPFFQRLLGVTAGQEAVLKNKGELKKILNKYIDYYPGSSEGFPEVKEENVNVPMSEEQAKIYKALMGEIPWLLRKKIELGLAPGKQDLNRLMPFLTGARMISNSTAGFEPDPKLIKSPKLEQAVEYLKNKIKKEKDYKALVYSNYLASGVEPYKKYLEEAKIPYGEFTGDINDSLRNQLVQDYNNNKLKALLISSAGAEGLDLKGTRLVQILEPHFNNEKIKQVIGRAARYKSHEALDPEKRNVLVQRYLSSIPQSFWQKIFGGKSSSTDEYLQGMAQKKEELNKQVINLIKS